MPPIPSGKPSWISLIRMGKPMVLGKPMVPPIPGGKRSWISLIGIDCR
ncbi:MAG: hypothetical protein NXI04_29790 [Planctomycetaceae bacterium]|nr:hypothetical protein [Planctomycetaceae bacterium]